jgi:uncharacterized membrane protein YphA (DoxX/SURF4 family)
MRRLLATHAPAAVIIIRLMDGGVFIFEGIQKFLFPAEVRAGRFAKTGIPSPEIVAPFVGCFEISGSNFIDGLLEAVFSEEFMFLLLKLKAVVSTLCSIRRPPC